MLASGLIYFIVSCISLRCACHFVNRIDRMRVSFPRYFDTPHFWPVWAETKYGDMLCNPTDHVSRTLVNFGVWEPTVSETIRSLLDPADVFVDVGAHMGYHTLIASKAVGPKGHVLSVEPFPENMVCLARMVRRNELLNVSIISNAISDACRLSYLFAGKCGNLGQTSFRAVSNMGVAAICTRMDEVVPRDLWHRIRLIKIDVEGAEYQVISGMSALLQAGCCDFIICEVTDEYLHEMGSSARQLVTAISDYGFVPFVTAKQSSMAWQDLPSDFDYSRQVDILFARVAALPYLTQRVSMISD